MFTQTWSGVNYSLSEAMKMDELWYVVKILRVDRYSFSQNIAMIVITVFAILLTLLAPNAAQVSERIKPKIRNSVIIAILGIWCVVSLSNVSTFLYFNF